MLLLLLALALTADVRDVAVEIVLEEPEKNVNYTQISQLTNLDHETGRTDNLAVLLNYSYISLSQNFSHITQVSLNRQRVANTGNFLFNETTELCVQATPLNFEDPNLSNNYYCKTFFEEEKEVKEPSCCNIELELGNKILSNGETLEFYIHSCFETPVEYWVENEFREVVKPILNTSNSNVKRYTPRQEGGFVVLAQNECFQDKKIFLVQREEKEEFFEANIPEQISSGDYLDLEIRGYKGGHNRRAIRFWLERNGERKTSITTVMINLKNTDFDFRVPFHIPSDLESGMYEILIEGFESSVRERVYVFSEKTITVTPSEPKINSFFTRKQIFDGSLNIFLGFDEQQTALIHTSKGSFIAHPGYTLVNISFPNEIILAQIIGYEHSLTWIRLNLSQPEITSSEETISRNTSAENSTLEPLEINLEDETKQSYLFFFLPLLILIFWKDLIKIKTKFFK